MSPTRLSNKLLFNVYSDFEPLNYYKRRRL